MAGKQVAYSVEGLTYVQGDKVDLAASKGKNAVVIELWATWYCTFPILSLLSYPLYLAQLICITCSYTGVHRVETVSHICQHYTRNTRYDSLPLHHP
jgi:hypothetical protein